LPLGHHLGSRTSNPDEAETKISLALQRFVVQFNEYFRRKEHMDSETWEEEQVRSGITNHLKEWAKTFVIKGTII
jgi:hypothetical protein